MCIRLAEQIFVLQRKINHVLCNAQLLFALNFYFHRQLVVVVVNKCDGGRRGGDAARTRTDDHCRRRSVAPSAASQRRNPVGFRKTLRRRRRQHEQGNFHPGTKFVLISTHKWIARLFFLWQKCMKHVSYFLGNFLTGASLIYNKKTINLFMNFGMLA